MRLNVTEYIQFQEMKEYICKKDFYIEDIQFAKKGDHVILMPDNSTVVNTNGNQRVTCMPQIVEDKEFFTPTFKCTEPDMVNSPPHYSWLKEKCGLEVIDITRHLDFDLGNAIKYILRAGRKKDAVEDLKKAIWYLNDKIKLLENESN